jgi:site-specific recombinase XerD
MEFDNYLQYLVQRDLGENALRVTKRALERFNSFLHNESVVDLEVVDGPLLLRYAETLSNLKPSTIRHQLFIVCRYLDYVDSTRQD